jgi:hypothetical protein
MQVKLALSAWDVFKAKIRLVSVASVLRVHHLCAKSTKVFKKGMLSLDFSGLGLD